MCTHIMSVQLTNSFFSLCISYTHAFFGEIEKGKCMKWDPLKGGILTHDH